MKKLFTILSIVLCLSLLGGCSVDITVHDENGNSVPLADDVESIVNDLISDATTTTTPQQDDSRADDTPSSTTSNTKPGKTKKTSAKTSPTKKPTPSATTSVTSTTSSTVKKSQATSTSKKDHGTPNINGTFHDDMADTVLTMLNKARKDAGLNELVMDKGNMMNAAKIRAKEITAYWEHKRPDGDNWDTVFNEEGVKYNARGENLADGHQSAEAVFTAWMESPGHKANIMEGRFTHISIDCLEYNGHFYWVQLFGANIKR